LSQVRDDRDVDGVADPPDGVERLGERQDVRVRNRLDGRDPEPLAQTASKPASSASFALSASCAPAARSTGCSGDGCRKRGNKASRIGRGLISTGQGAAIDAFCSAIRRSDVSEVAQAFLKIYERAYRSVS
jgi:hypothetical protein